MSELQDLPTADSVHATGKCVCSLLLTGSLCGRSSDRFFGLAVSPIVVVVGGGWLKRSAGTI